MWLLVRIIEQSILGSRDYYSHQLYKTRRTVLLGVLYLMMNLRIVTALSFCLLLCPQRVRSSVDSLLKNETLSNGNVGNILEKFFFGLRTTYLLTNKSRHITFVSASNDDLRRAQSLLERYPYIICNDTENCGYSDVFSRGSVVVLFLEDVSEDTLRSKDKFLLRCIKCKILFVSDGHIQVNDIRVIFTTAMAMNVQYIQFAHVNKDGVKLYGNFLGKNCSVEVRLIAVWRPGFGLSEIHTWAFQLVKNLNGCPISVSSLNFQPKMVIHEEPDGSLTVVGGREGKLLLTLAEKLNFTLALSYPTEMNRMKYSRKISIINDVIAGIREVGIGRLLPSNDLNKRVAFSISYDSECVTWAVPLVINWPNNFLWIEFSWEVWVPVGLIFALTCAVGYVDRNLNFPKIGRRRNVGLFRTVMDDFAVLLGNPAVHVSFSAGGRFMLMVNLCYAMVITTAYKSSLSATLATHDGTPMFVDVEGILRGNLSVGGSLYDYKILEEQEAASELTSVLLNRFVVNNDDAENLHRLKYHHDYAFLARLSSLNYHKQKMVKDHESISFDTVSDCVLHYYTVIVFKKISSLRKPTNNMIKRLRESGILDHWDYDEMYSEKIFEGRDSGRYFENDTSYKFRTVLILYSSCIAVSVIIFLIEILAAQFDPKKRKLRAKPGSYNIRQTFIN